MPNSTKRVMALFAFLMLLLSGKLVAKPILLSRDTLVAPHSAFFTVFLIGDAGEPSPAGHDTNLELLKQQLQAAGANSAVLYLGDNIYPRGMPDEGAPGRADAERRMKDQLSILADYKGQVFIIPGNHDWGQGRPAGWKLIQNQEKFVEEYLGRGNVFVPDDGCPGPVEISLNDKIVLVVLDTQWWLHPWDKPGEESDCEFKDPASIVVQLEDILHRNRNKKMMFAAHHPMYSYGTHGGYSVFRQHLFPLTDFIHWLYIPFPVVGSIYPFYRTVLGNIQDIPNPKYKVMRNAIRDVLNKYPDLVYVNGHDHSLQYIVRDSIHYVISGAGSKRTPVKKGKYSFFADNRKGFGRVDYFSDGKDSLTFWVTDADKEGGEQVFKKEIGNKPFRSEPVVEVPARNFSDSVVTVVASQQYEAGSLKRWVLGNNYRDVWEQPIKVPVFDIGSEKGGMKILQRGGGMQTKSLRLEAADGKEYVLRSVEKDAENAIPPILRKTLAADIVQDQISASHPYAAYVIAPMAEAVGVPHAHPQLVFIPDDPRLGEYRRAFANTLALFEEREPQVNEGTSNGKEVKTLSTAKMLEKLHEDNDNRVNQREVLRARLFDMILADWDRHDDQWRWAVDKKKGGSVFTAIPRDRDQVFFVNEGAFPSVASRKWALPKIQGFGSRIRDVNGFMFNGRYFDRSFLTQPSLEEWLSLADTLKARLTDQVIEEAIRLWPDSVYTLAGKEVIAKLKSRRNELSTYARTYYLFLAKTVSVVGSDKNEYFDVSRSVDGQTQVTVYKISKKGDREQLIYQRTFKTSETKEIRLYGLGGKDVFDIKGVVEDGIKVRVIGGPGADQITDHSQVAGWSKKTLVYDTQDSTQLQLGAESRNLTSDHPDVNTYDRKDFKYDYFGPVLSANYNVDDGIFLGGGIQIKKMGFRKDPYAANHILTGNVAFATRAYNFNYEGNFIHMLGKLDLQLNLDIRAPNFVRNFFGLGNETKFKSSEHTIRYYRVRFEDLSANALLRYRVGSQTLSFGPALQTVEVEETKGRFINNTLENSLDPATLFGRRQYGGLKVGYLLDNRDSKILPTRGVVLRLSGDVMTGLNSSSNRYSQFTSDLSFYWSLRLPAIFTLATRFGGGVNFGDFEFFQANTLGGLSNLRGFRRTRFAGRSSFYNNTELRVKLFSLKTYLFPAYVGVLGFHDVGRVWLKAEESDVWHRGYGGGIWFAPFKQVVVSAIYGISKEEKLPLIRVGFLF